MVMLNRAIHSALKDCFKLRRSEKILILSDEEKKSLGYAFYEKATELSDHPYLLVIPTSGNHRVEPPKHISGLMCHVDAIVMLTQRSLSHTQARRNASQHGARIASLPAVTKETLIRTLDGDYTQLINTSRKLADILTIGRSAHLMTPAGTDITFSLSRMRGYADTGMIHEAGHFSNLPAGEGCAAPAQSTTNGRLVIDASFSGIGLIHKPIHMSVQNGYAVRITGDEEAQKLRKLLKPHGRSGRHIAEIGIGTNPNAKITGCTLEDEKVLGTVHMALGNNVSFGGKVSVGCHFDGVMLKPTLIIDGKSILEDGVLQV